MGLFGKVFGKEACSICGNEVGALKKRQLEDGVLCTDCVKKLSPWFEERKHSTVSDIASQLADRETNRERLARFNATRQFGDGGALRIDDASRSFFAFVDPSISLFDKSRKQSEAERIAALNPDVVSIDQVTDVDLDIVETRHEQKRTENGEQVSYSPRHYVYMYQFTLVVSVDHPYIKTIRIPLNAEALHIANVGERRKATLNERAAKWIVDTATGWEGPALVEDRVEFGDESLLAQVMRSDYEIPSYAYGFKVDQFANWEDIKRYRYLLATADAAKAALTAPSPASPTRS